MILDAKLVNGDLIILDGAMGTEIRKFGATLDPVVWAGAASLHYPDAVRGAHEAYIRAGADIITTNTFATCRHVLAGAGLDDRTVEINQRATELAMQARHNAATGRDVAIAGSLSGMDALVPGTVTHDPRYRPDKEARAGYLTELAALEISTNYCELSLLDDEEFEAFQRIEQLRESDFEPMVAPQFLVKELRGEDGPAPFGVGLEVPGPFPVGASKTEKPQNERSHGSDEQLRFEALGTFRSNVAQRESEAVALEVANGLLDLHASGVDTFDAGGGAAVMRQRRGKQPRGSCRYFARRERRFRGRPGPQRYARTRYSRHQYRC